MEDFYAAIGGWPAEPEVIECLWRAMHDEEPHNQRAAARVLARVGRLDAGLGARVEGLARSAEEPATRAVALDALIRGWPSVGQLADLLASHRHSASPPSGWWPSRER